MSSLPPATPAVLFVKDALPETITSELMPYIAPATWSRTGGYINGHSIAKNNKLASICWSSLSCCLLSRTPSRAQLARGSDLAFTETALLEIHGLQRSMHVLLFQ